MRIAAVLATALPLLRCANEGSYKVCWSVGGFVADEHPADDCPRPALDIDIACPGNGLDTVVLDWVDGEPGVCAGEVVHSTDHACRDGVATGLVEAGTYNLCAEALSPDRERLTGVVVAADVPVDQDDLVVVALPLPFVPDCQNGLDDDLDDRIDDQDPQCSDDSDAAE